METREAACKAALVQGVKLGAGLRMAHTSRYLLGTSLFPGPPCSELGSPVSKCQDGGSEWAELEPKFSYLPRTGLATGAGAVLAQSKWYSWAGGWTAYPQLGTPSMTGGREQEAGT